MHEAMASRDWEVADISFDAWVSDLETVVEAVGVKRFALLGVSQSCSVSIAYAVRHPERVSRLILYGGFALGACLRSPAARERHKAMATLVRLEWVQTIQSSVKYLEPNLYRTRQRICSIRSTVAATGHFR